MNLLLDSRALLRALHAPDKIAPQAVEAIRDRRKVVYFSAASVWELDLKGSSGKLELPDDWVTAAVEAGFVELPVRAIETRARPTALASSGSVRPAPRGAGDGARASHRDPGRADRPVWSGRSHRVAEWAARRSTPPRLDAARPRIQTSLRPVLIGAP